MNHWSHVPLAELIETTGTSLTPHGENKWVGPHSQHSSRSGECLVVWEDNWWCSSCRRKGDAADWLVDCGRAENRREAAELLIQKYGPSPQEWQDPLPFPQFHGLSFPVVTLPPLLRRFVEEESEALQVPPDLIATQVLAVASAASANKARVQVKQGWQEPLNIYVVDVMDSGERKSPAQRDTTAPLEEIQRELAEEARPEIARAKMARDLLDAQLSKLKNEAAKPNKSDAEREALSGRALELAETLANSEAPTSPRLLCDDVTSEALASLLSENGGVMALFSTEGGIFETMAGRYSDGHLALDVHLKSYSGDTLRVDRKGRPPEFVARPLLTLCLCVQPEVIRNLSSKFRGRGLLARPLYSIPESKVGYRLSDPLPLSEETRMGYRGAVRSIAYLSKETPDEPHLLEVDSEAAELLTKYQDELEPQLRPGGSLRDVRDWILKLPGAVARLAGIIHIVEHSDPDRPEPWTSSISISTMGRAITLGRYFTSHAQAAFGLMGVAGPLGIAMDLWEVMMAKGFEQFSRRDIHQAVKHRYSPEEVGSGLRVLEEMGYIRQLLAHPSDPKGGRPNSPIYEVNPRGSNDREYAEGGFESFEGFESSNLKNNIHREVNKIGDKETPSDHGDRVSTGPFAGTEELPNDSGFMADIGADQEVSDKYSPSSMYSQNPQNPQNLDFKYVTDVEEARQVVTSLLTEPVIGLDIETTGLDPVLEKIRTVQLSGKGRTWVIDAYRVSMEELKPLISTGPVKVIHNAKFEAGFFWESFAAVMPEPMFDTMLAAQVIDGGEHYRVKGYFTLAAACERFLGVTLDKTQQTSDWGEELSLQQIEYAAWDAAVLLPLYERLKEESE